jgi:hypothetical protein
VTAAGRFESPAAAVTLAATLAGMGLPVPAAASRWPRPDGPLWMLFEVEVAIGAHLIEMAGGQPYAVRTDGALGRLRGHHDRFPTDQLPSVAELGAAPTLATTQLLLNLPLRPGGESTGLAATVFATGRAARFAIRQCLDAGVEGEVSLVNLHRSGEAPRWHVRLRLAGPLPAGTARLLAGLPDITVSTGVSGSSRLLIAWGHWLPADGGRLATLVPPQQTWLLTAEHGGYVVDATTAEVPLASLVTSATPVPMLPGTPVPSLAHLHQQVVVRRSRRASDRVDAILFLDAELDRVRRFVAARPLALAETAHIVFGPGRHLLVAPPEALADVPVGTPVRRIGPGALFLESVAALSPQVPAAARQHLFAVDDVSIVVLARDTAVRLLLVDQRPAWSLWLGAMPVVAADISTAGREILGRFAAIAPSGSAAPGAPGAAGGLGPSIGRPAPAGSGMAEALDRAARALAMGRLDEAAELYEYAGVHDRAGHLFRRIALNLPDEGSDE